MAIPAKAIALGKAQTFGSVVAHLGYQPCRPLIFGEGKRGLGQLRAETLPPIVWSYQCRYRELVRRLPRPARGIAEPDHRRRVRLHVIEGDEPLPHQSRWRVALPLLKQIKRWRLRIAHGQ